MLNTKPGSNNSDNFIPIYGSVEEIRNQIANAILFASSIISFPVFVSSLWRSLDAGWLNSVYLHILVYSLLLLVTIFRNRISLVFRAYAVISFAFILGVGGLVTWGLIGMGLFLLMTGCVFTTLFFGSRAGLAFLGAAIVAVIITGVSITSGRISQDFDAKLYATNRTSWILATTAFAVLAATVIAGFGRIFGFLTVSMGLLKVSAGERERSNVELEIEIAERKKTEKALKEKEKQLRTIGDNLPVGMIFQLESKPDGSSKFTYVSAAVEKLHECTAEEAIADPDLLFNRVHEDDVADWQKATERAVADLNVYDHEMRIRRKSGEIRHHRMVSKPRRLEDGTILFDGIDIDVTEHKQMLEDLRNSEERFRLLSEYSPMGAFQTDNDGRVLFTNKRWREITGLTLEESLGFGWSKALHPDDSDVILKEWDECLREGKGWAGEFRFNKPSGEVRWVYTVTAPIRSGTGNIIGHIGANEDITERKKLEMELQNIQKLESIGVLAGGIAHDFNNILTALWGNIQLSVMNLGDTGDNATLDLLRDSEKACKRALSLTQQLLTFAKGGDPVRKAISVAPVIKDSSRFALRGSNVRCEYDIPDDLWMVKADEGQINQVVQNLVINADQAMPEGGAIKISAENISVQDKTEILPLTAGPYVRVSVEDEGDGIPGDRLNKIFDPYFSTKRKGSGLGLAVSFSIIRKHEGHITVSSELTRGSTFTFFLPALPEKRAERDKEAEITKGRGRILLMEDEEAVGNIGSKMLDHLGYEVDLVDNGDDAIKMYKDAIQSNHPYAAVILDLTIPGGTGGRKCIGKLLEIDPEVKAIVTSGYSTDPVMSDHRKYGFKGVLPKPFEIKNIAGTLKKVIENE